MRFTKLLSLVCLGLWFASLLPCVAAAPSWDIDAQGHLITALCPGPHGTVWIGTEESGIWRYDPAAPADKQFTPYTTQDGLGDNNAYTLAVDKAGRLWAGTLNHGVSVFNGKQWRTYGPVDGPLGSRVFALAVNPKDGGVWGATEAGLFRYVNSRWTYFTRADGLPSDQANALAFDQGGTLYVGTQCDGIAIASPADGYKSWRVVPGPAALPNAPSGTGLPSALINCLLVTKNGTVYAGTTCGLASTQDKGVTWHYRRGLDWKAKEEGRYPPVTPVSVTISGNLLSEDYVTALAERADGSIFVGHRQTSVEAFSPKTWLRVQSGLNGAMTDSDISSLLVAGQTAWAGLYGGGLLPPGAAPAETTLASSQPAAPLPVPPLPVSAKPPTLAELKTMISRANALLGDMPVGSGVYLGEDWRTQGDWVGRYGRQYAELCAIQSPFDHFPVSTLGYSAQCFEGPQHPKGENFRRWVTWITTDNPHSLYDPIIGHRRQAEMDDHGEAYDPSQEGPGLYFKVIVPAGLHRVSFYFFNKDGYFSGNRFRDYLIQLKPYAASLDQAEKAAPLAQARVHNFRGGVYPQFLLAGPSTYYFRLARNDSFNVICSAVFIDRVADTIAAKEDMNTLFLAGKRYDPPTSAKLPLTPNVELAKRLWGNPSSQHPYRIDAKNFTADRVLAYRAAVAAHAPQALLDNWHWNLRLWSESDRQQFDKVMADAFQALLAKYPDLKYIRD